MKNIDEQIKSLQLGRAIVLSVVKKLPKESIGRRDYVYDINEGMLDAIETLTRLGALIEFVEEE